LKPYYEDTRAGIVVYHANYKDVLPSLVGVDHIITDPPFSDRTHDAPRAAPSLVTDGIREPLAYESWGEQEIKEFCDMMKCDGWWVIITDHVLVPLWEKYQKERYVFAPLPSFTPGRGVRFTGDGPSSWTDWIVVSRTAKQSKWGTLPGGYINNHRDKRYIGGKPLGLMLSLVRDYSRISETICDPCCGNGTTLEAAKMLGRRVIGIDISEECCRATVARLQQETLQFQPPAALEREQELKI
jgi:site-specific DNA-methyltransferase (adenine-specific)